MVISGAQLGMVIPGPGEGVPLEVKIGGERVGVWLDHTGIHFHQAGAEGSKGFLAWETAIAMSLIPRRSRPNHKRSAA